MNIELTYRITALVNDFRHFALLAEDAGNLTVQERGEALENAKDVAFQLATLMDLNTAAINAALYRAYSDSQQNR